jgi:two-component system chemotaxis response regulator CheB
MKDNGSYNIVQDQKSSIVWGMPGKAVEFNAADKVVPLDQVAFQIKKYLKL